MRIRDILFNNKVKYILEYSLILLCYIIILYILIVFKSIILMYLEVSEVEADNFEVSFYIYTGPIFFITYSWFLNKKLNIGREHKNAALKIYQFSAIYSLINYGFAIILLAFPRIKGSLWELG